jgi:acetyl-CoA acyltransferase
VANAAQMIELGLADITIAAGVESMSCMPMMLGQGLHYNPAIFDGQHDLGLAYGMGLTAEKVASQWHISREDQDVFALASHQKAMHALQSGYFLPEINPYTIKAPMPDLATGDIQTIERIITHDEGPRPDTSLAALAKLPTLFATKGSVTAGNASQMSDGAAAILIMSEAAIKRTGATPIARYASFSVAGVAPDIMGIGPVAAVPLALKAAGIGLADIGWIELNEAFAAQALAVIRTLDLDTHKVNPWGGAIALGHPLGATGAIRTATLLNAFTQQPHLTHGMITMCIGSGMGAAGIFERV